MKKITLLVSVLVLIAAVFVLVVTKSDFLKKSERFDGYIVWNSEGIIFAENLKIGDQKVQILSEPIWVKQPIIENDLYGKALVVEKSSESNAGDETRIIKVIFAGTIETESNNGYGHLGKYKAQVDIKEVIEYSKPDLADISL
jgi:hypothetical protein